MMTRLFQGFSALFFLFVGCTQTPLVSVPNAPSVPVFLPGSPGTADQSLVQKVAMDDPPPQDGGGAPPFSCDSLPVYTPPPPRSCDFFIPSVPYSITRSGTYCLNQNVTDGAGGEILIQADNVVIDGRNHRVSVPSSIKSVGHSGITVRNIRLAQGGIDFSYGGGRGGIHILNSQMGGISLGGYTGITIRGNTLAGGLSLYGEGSVRGVSGGKVMNGIHWSDRNTIEDNTFSGRGIPDARFVIISMMRCSVFQRNRVEALDSTGQILQVHYSHFNTFDGNTFRITYPSAPLVGYEERYGVMVRDGSSNNAFTNNEIRSNGATAFLLGSPGNEASGWNHPDVWGHDNLVRGNRIYLGTGVNNVAAFRHMTTAGNDVVDHNLIYAQSTQTGALWISGVDSPRNATYTNNTVVADQGVAARVESTGDLKFRNNIFYSAGGAAITAGAGGHLDSDYNDFFSGASALPIRYWDSCCGTRSYGIRTANPAEDFTIATGLDGHSNAIDPRFVDAANLDFHMSPSNALLGAGEGGSDPGALPRIITSCGAVDHDSILGADLDTGAKYYCLVIEKDGITLDGNGKRVNGFIFVNALFPAFHKNIRVRNFAGGRFLVRGDVRNLRVENNTFDYIMIDEDMDGGPDYMSDSVFRNNFVMTNLTAFMATGGRNNLLTGNIFAMPATGWEWSATVEIYGGGYKLDHNTIHRAVTGQLVEMYLGLPGLEQITRNNILSHPGGDSIFGASYFTFLGYNGDFNAFAHKAGSLVMSVGWPPSPSYSTLEEWRSASAAAGSPDDVNSIEIGSSQPLFVKENPAVREDFYLAPSSAALLSGEDGTHVGAMPLAPCHMTWSCGAWSECRLGRKTRVCTNPNFMCGTGDGKPSEVSGCIYKPGPIRLPIEVPTDNILE